MSETVTLDQIRDLIRAEKIHPEDIFDPEDLKPLLDKAKAEGYAEGRFKTAWEEDQKKTEEKKHQEVEKESEKPDKYLDPSQNPMIRTDEGE